MNKNEIKMWNLFSTYKTINSFLWTVALICVFSWIAKFSIMFFNEQQSYIQYSAKVLEVNTVINNNIVTSTANVKIDGLGTITLNCDNNAANLHEGDKLTVYNHNNLFSLDKPKQCSKSIVSIVNIISIISLILWILLFVADKVILIPFFKYGGIEAWAYNNIRPRN